MPSHRLVLGACLILGLTTAIATAQSSEKSSSEQTSADQASSSDTSFLAGPPVSDRASTSSAGFGAESGPRTERPIVVPVTQWLRTLRQVDLTPEQSKQTRQIAGELRDASQAYRKANAEEIKAVREMIKQAREDQQRLSDEQRARIDALHKKRPDVEAFQQRIWALLDADQQARMTSLLAEQREAIAKRRAKLREEGMSDEQIESLEKRRSERRGRRGNRNKS